MVIQGDREGMNSRIYIVEYTKEERENEAGKGRG